ncbi:MAG: hypothetical protein PHN84_14025 [Desulfuromonadaceae bacterium]|nr:hypothetical protein [Desulfuromonadaceae bacterium]MDD2856992.1 hypothetical protein [Desulfuromonadaceae bacterium]
MKKLIAWMFAVFSCLAAVPAQAFDTTIPGLDSRVSLSGFGTLGFAVSDKNYRYQRFVDDDGTWKRDSIFGLQVDAKINDEFSVTVQGKVAPSLSSDNSIEPVLSWAFLSWRPTNDLQVRLGRLRLPVYLHSENMDVGATYDFARLPAEIYSSVPTTDVDGAGFSKAWDTETGEFTLDGYVGTTATNYRYYRRDNEPLILQQSGTYFVPVRQAAYGMRLSLRQGDDIYRAGIHDAYTRITDYQLMPSNFPYVPVAAGIGYYQTSNLMPGSGVKMVRSIHSLGYVLGADVGVGDGFRVTGEYVYRNVRNVTTGPDSMAGYIAVQKPIGAWTPYISVATLQSMSKTRNLYNKVNSSRVPVLNVTAAQINASQRAGADAVIAFDQTTIMLTVFRTGS